MSLIFLMEISCWGAYFGDNTLPNNRYRSVAKGRNLRTVHFIQSVKLSNQASQSKLKHKTARKTIFLLKIRKFLNNKPQEEGVKVNIIHLSESSTIIQYLSHFLSLNTKLLNILRRKCEENEHRRKEGKNSKYMKKWWHT